MRARRRARERQGEDRNRKDTCGHEEPDRLRTGAPQAAFMVTVQAAGKMATAAGQGIRPVDFMIMTVPTMTANMPANIVSAAW